jgi:hypothetical protein
MARIAGGCMTETVDGVRGRLVPGDRGPAVGRPGEARRGAAEDRGIHRKQQVPLIAPSLVHRNNSLSVICSVVRASW